MPILQLPTGLQLNYYISRGGQRVPDLDPAKRTVVFLHALCTNASAWDAQMADPRLNRLYNLVTFDGELSTSLSCSCYIVSVLFPSAPRAWEASRTGLQPDRSRPLPAPP